MGSLTVHAPIPHLHAPPDLPPATLAATCSPPSSTFSLDRQTLKVKKIQAKNGEGGGWREGHKMFEERTPRRKLIQCSHCGGLL